MGTNANATNFFSPAKWVVSTVAGEGTHTTIGAAITSASSGDTVVIMPGTYTENPALKAGVNLTAFTGDSITPNVIINGKCTYSGTGRVSISNIQIKTNSDYFLSVTGTNASQVFLNNCSLNCNNNTGIQYSSSSSSSGITLINCTGDLATTGISYYNISSNGALSIINCDLGNSGNSTTASSNSSGIVYINYSELYCPISITSNGNFYVEHGLFELNGVNTTAITLAGTGTDNTIKFSRFSTGTASAISIGTGTTVEMDFCTVFSSNTNAITGAGTLQLGGITFTGSSSLINTTTITNQKTTVGTLAIDGATTYAPICGATTATGAVQSASTGMSNSGYVLTSTGASSLPTWQAGGGGGGGVTTVDGDTGSVTGATISLTGATTAGSSVFFSGSGTALTYNNTDAGFNTILGSGAGNASLVGHGAAGNIGLGYQTLAALTTGSTNTAIGYQALNINTIGHNNIAIGFGTLAFNVSGSNNSAIGTQSLQNNTATGNTGVGFLALFSNTSGASNTAIGTSALTSNVGGADNTACGVSALASCSSGSTNIGLGYSAGSNITTTSNNIEIGNTGITGDSGVIRIGTSGTHTTCYVQGIDGVTVTGSAVLCSSTGQLGDVASSIRFKENVKDLGDKSSQLLNLRPVQFNYIQDEDKNTCFGLIAEEVQEIFPELVVHKDGKPYSVKYHEMPSLLLNEIIKLKKEISELKSLVRK